MGMQSPIHSHGWMTMSQYSLDAFLTDLRAIDGVATAPVETVRTRVAPLVRRYAAEADWSEPGLRSCDESQGFGITILNEEADDTLLIEAICWLPGRGVAPHDHQTWGVVVGIEGAETNVSWDRHDDGSRPDRAELTMADEISIGPGDTCVLAPDDIHSVRNTGETPSLSLHVYGYSLRTRNRSEFDPITGTRRPCPQRTRRTA